MTAQLRTLASDIGLVNEAYDAMAREVTDEDREAYLTLRPASYIAPDLDTHLELQRQRAIRELVGGEQ